MLRFLTSFKHISPEDTFFAPLLHEDCRMNSVASRDNITRDLVKIEYFEVFDDARRFEVIRYSAELQITQMFFASLKTFLFLNSRCITMTR